jgi:hypothetical protein
VKEHGSYYDLMHILLVWLERELRRKERKSRMMIGMNGDVESGKGMSVGDEG